MKIVGTARVGTTITIAHDGHPADGRTATVVSVDESAGGVGRRRERHGRL